MPHSSFRIPLGFSNKSSNLCFGSPIPFSVKELIKALFSFCSFLLSVFFSSVCRIPLPLWFLFLGSEPITKPLTHWAVTQPVLFYLDELPCVQILNITLVHTRMREKELLWLLVMFVSQVNPVKPEVSGPFRNKGQKKKRGEGDLKMALRFGNF